MFTTEKFNSYGSKVHMQVRLVRHTIMTCNAYLLTHCFSPYITNPFKPSHHLKTQTFIDPFIAR